jgi:hypothetical protein
VLFQFSHQIFAMVRLLCIFLMVVASLPLFGQQTKYSRLKINLEERELRELGALGIALQGIEYRPELYVIGEYSQDEKKIIADAGFLFEVLIDDMAQYYQSRNAGLNKAALEASWRIYDQQKRYQTPQNFSLGSMGGYYTYAELLAALDNMHAQFPELISAKAAIGETLTIQGRPVYWMRISNNPVVEQDKPKVLYTALTHAREPASMQQMIYQMWYLLENYGSDPEITYLVDNMEMYFIPCVNPDGYLYNQQINPNGGGMHRKNMRVNADNSIGVDLNRNFGYMWGIDNTGSSPNPSSNTFRGTGPFSEPETQMVKEFVETFDFSLALNNHTYSDLLIYPWGYQNQLTPDADVFIAFAQLMTRENNYTYGTCFETLNYFANGGSDDWFYGEQQTKNKVFAFTPEAGSPSDGFWPAISRIEEICAGHTGMNLYLARLALAYAELKPVEGLEVNAHEFYFPFDLTNYGLNTPANFTVSLNPISPLILEHGQPVVFEQMGVLQTITDSIYMVLHPSTYQGLIFDFEVLINNGDFTWRDTVTLHFGEPDPLFTDNFATATNWAGNTWGLDDTYYVSEPYSMADSPGAEYVNNANAILTLDQPVDLLNYDIAFAEFYARWDIERNYDFVQFMVSENAGDTWLAMPGKYTVLGTNNQDPGKPIYHGTQNSWVRERISLNQFAGKEIMIRFRLVSDFSITRDGFYFDDFEVFAFKQFQPVPPVINGQEPLTILMGESFSMQMDWLFVEDEFVNYPNGHTLHILNGENFEANGLVISPTPDFSGQLEIPVKVDNGIMHSQVFPFQVEVLNTVSVNKPLNQKPRVFFSNQNKSLSIALPDGMFPQVYQISVFDITGRQVFNEKILVSSSLHLINLELYPGLYLYQLSGKTTLSGKIPVF